MPDRKKRPIARSGKGRAFLKFLIGLLVVFIVCGGAYLFILEFDKAPAPKPTEAPVLATEAPVEATDAPIEATDAPAEATDAPAQATEAPTDAPLALTTDAPSEFSERVTGLSVPEAGDGAKYGMLEFAIEGDRLSIAAYAYIEGADAARSETYLVVRRASGEIEAAYATWRTENTTGLDFGNAAGSNLDSACFAARISGAELADAWYRLGILIVNGDTSVYVPVSEDAYSFIVAGGSFIRYAE